ncbi:unnamed protein product [Wickerhamomyces anomalus]
MAYSQKDLEKAIYKTTMLTLKDVLSRQTSESKSSKSKLPSNTSDKKSKRRSTNVVTFDSDSEDEDTTPDEAENYFKVPSFNVKKVTYDDDYFIKYADEYITFTGKNPTTFHAIHFFSKLLEANGFKYLSEKDEWSDLSAGLYYTTRNSTSLGAFAVGKDWKPENGVGIVGSHIDALAAKLKPVSSKTKVDGYELLGVANYAGALSPTWFDRDLGIGGRVLIRVEDKSSSTGYKIISKLISSSPKPIARISTLAEHFGAAAAPPYDKEIKAIPVIGYNSGSDSEPTKEEKKSPLFGKHPLDLLRFIGELAETSVADIVQLDLDLFDVQPGSKGGLRDDFVFAPRIDDRVCSFAAINALIEFTKNGPIPSDSFSQVLLFDNEEVGSLTRQGAKTDVTHLLNPTYKNEYLDDHFAVPNKGITIALDPNGHMATDSVGQTIAQEVARLNDDELQYFQIKNGARSGGTIGPTISSNTGARTIDLGIPQLSMHSIRAAIGVKDVGLGVKYFNGFFKYWQDVNKSFGDL